jgi:hypothetical protein
MSLFCDKPFFIRRWLANKGFTGTLSDALLAYFKSKSGLSTGTLMDHIRHVMLGMGYTGTLADQLTKFFYDKTNTVKRWEAERKFWQDFSLDFSSGVVVSDYLLLETGDFMLLETGDKVLLES